MLNGPVESKAVVTPEQPLIVLKELILYLPFVAIKRRKDEEVQLVGVLIAL